MLHFQKLMDLSTCPGSLCQGLLLSLLPTNSVVSSCILGALPHKFWRCNVDTFPFILLLNGCNKILDCVVHERLPSRMLLGA